MDKRRVYEHEIDRMDTPDPVSWVVGVHSPLHTVFCVRLLRTCETQFGIDDGELRIVVDSNQKTEEGVHKMSLFEMLILLGAAATWWWINRKKTVTAVPKETTEDLFKFKRVDEDGFIETEDGRYMMMMEVQPILMATKGPMEQKAVWLHYRNLAASLPHAMRIRMEVQHYNLDDYFQELKSQAISMGDQTELAYLQEQQQVFEYVMAERKTLDCRFYLFLETDSRFLSDVGLRLDSPLFQDIFNLFQRAASTEDNEVVAKQELYNSLRVAQSSLHTSGIWTQQMLKKDVEEWLYRSTNREMASVVSYSDRIQGSSEEGEAKWFSIGKNTFEKESA